MADLALRFLVLLLFISLGQSRVLRLYSSDDLISDGIDRIHDDEYPILSANVSVASTKTCEHQYGFLPCAENAGGFIFQILIYQGLIMFGEKELATGSKVLFDILGTRKIVGIIFRILVGLPPLLIMIVSGVFSNKEDAQSKVSLGVGIYAGVTVFTLTVQWGACLIFGSTKLTKEESSESSNPLVGKEAVTGLNDVGVKVDDKTQLMARMMLLSLIPYIIIQLVDIFKTSFGSHLVVILALIVSTAMLLLYFIYQVMNPWIQEMSLAYSKYETLRTGFLHHLQRHGNLIDKDGNLNILVIRNLFVEADKNADKSINKAELGKLIGQLIKTGEMKVDKQFAVSELMKSFDTNQDDFINDEEFMKGCSNLITDKQKNKTGDSNSSIHEILKDDDDQKKIDWIRSKVVMQAQMQLLKAESLIADDGNPNIEGIRNLFKKIDSNNNNEISKIELEQTIRTLNFGEFQPNYEDLIKDLFKDLDKDGNNVIDAVEFINGIKDMVNKYKESDNEEFYKVVKDKVVHGDSVVWTFIKSVLQIVLGIVAVTFLGEPLIASILQLSDSMNMPSFAVSFVVVPLAMNARAAIAAISPASHKDEKTASLTFTEIYGGVIMSNISNLTALLAIVYAKDLRWDYSAEVLTVLVVCAAIGIIACSRSYRLWTCSLAFLLYPFSLGLFYYVQYAWNWN